MTPEELLRLLLSKFYESPSGLEWGYVEGVTIRRLLGEEVEDEMRKYHKDEVV